MAKNDYQLTDEQKKKALEYWELKTEKGETPSLPELTFYLFGEGIDGRSKQARAMKDFLAEFQIKPKGSHVYVPKERKQLSEEDKAFIENNCDKMTAVEIARIIFKNPKLNNTAIESRTVNDYLKELSPIHLYSDPGEIPEGEWKAPNTYLQTVSRTNKHIKFDAAIDKENMTAMQEKEIRALMRYLNTYRFDMQINAYDEPKDRELFESVFVRYCYDKADLTEEEVDQYTILAGESVMERKIKRRAEHLQNLLDKQTGLGDDSQENAKVAMALVEAIGKATAELNACNKRQQDLVNSLKQKRSDRLSKRIKENASIINLIDKWKHAKTRKELINIAEKRKAKVKEAIEELANMEDVQAKILGISMDEALNG